jgi:hypothetical protein
MLASEVDRCLRQYPNLTLRTLIRIDELLAWLDARQQQRPVEGDLRASE